jgi:MerR family copper efflux transcriptional regulator
MKSTEVMTIGEVASRSGMPPKTIRFYEEIGLIAPANRLGNGYRAYTPQEVETLRFIHKARNLGFTLKEIEALLKLYRDRKRASREVKRLALQHVAAIAEGQHRVQIVSPRDRSVPLYRRTTTPQTSAGEP